MKNDRDFYGDAIICFYPAERKESVSLNRYNCAAESEKREIYFNSYLCKRKNLPFFFLNVETFLKLY